MTEDFTKKEYPNYIANAFRDFNKSDYQRIAELERQLADMTAERDAAVGRCSVLGAAINNLIIDVQDGYHEIKNSTATDKHERRSANKEYTHTAREYYLEQARKEIENE